MLIDFVRVTLFTFTLLLVGCETTQAPQGAATDLASQARIGTHYGGGIIFYIDRTGQHGLIAATRDQGMGDWYNALRLCEDYRGGGYSDWFMPSSDQLFRLHTKMAVVGGWDASSPMYWSSTESNENNVWIQGFTAGGTDRPAPNKGKSNQYICVRAIRAF